VLTERTNVGGGAAVKVAVTLFAASIVTLQLLLELGQAPPQPPNVLPLAGVAVSVTTVPDVSDAEHVPGHEMPPTLDDTLPVPVPPVATESVKLGGVTGASNVAVTLRAALIVTVHAPVPVQAPLQSANVLPFVGVAVSRTVVPAG
jgi:hypothetical protein